MFEFYYLPKFPAVHIYSFPYIHTTSILLTLFTLHFRSQILLLLTRGPCHLPYLTRMHTLKKWLNFTLTTVSYSTSFPLYIFLSLVIFRLLCYTSFTFDIMLSLAIVPGNFPYFIVTLTIKKILHFITYHSTLLFMFTALHVFITLVIFVNYLTFHITFHILLPLSIVPCHLPYFIRTFTI